MDVVELRGIHDDGLNQTLSDSDRLSIPGWRPTELWRSNHNVEVWIGLTVWKEDISDSLENSGDAARRICRAFGITNEVGQARHDQYVGLGSDLLETSGKGCK